MTEAMARAVDDVRDLGDITGAAIVVEPDEPHRLTVDLIAVHEPSTWGTNADPEALRQRQVPHRALAHTAACDALKYGQRCPFDDFEGTGGVDDWPAEPGEYLGWFWSSKSWGDSGWEYDAGIEWQRAGEPVARGEASWTLQGEGIWTCACRYMSSGPICTHCGKLKPESVGEVSP